MKTLTTAILVSEETSIEKGKRRIRSTTLNKENAEKVAEYINAQEAKERYSAEREAAALKQ